MLTAPVLLVSMDMTVLHLALPEITAELRPSATQTLWLVDHLRLHGRRTANHHRRPRRPHQPPAAAARRCGGVCGRLRGGRHGVQCGVLIAARAALGVAGATLAPSTLAPIRTLFHDPKQRSLATSVWVLSFLAGAAVGPVIGGLLLETLCVSVPLAGLAISTGMRTVWLGEALLAALAAALLAGHFATRARPASLSR